MTNYPTSLDTLTTGIGTDTQPLSNPDHPTQHTNECLAIQALETKVGVDSSAVATSLDYLVKSASSSDPGHKHTFTSLSNFNVSSPANGDVMQYSSASSKWANTATANFSLRFGGTGADGALTVSSGTTTISLGSAAVFVKNYTSISITGTGKVAFSNANANGTKIILRSQGNVTLTSSQAPMLDASALGGTGGTATNAGNNTGCLVWVVNNGTGSVTNTSAGTGGALPTSKFNTTYFADSFDHYTSIAPGAGGGGGSSESGTGGTGGNGGGALIIECGGALNFTTASGISVSGANATNGTGTRAGGGGGGGSGNCLILYNTLTSASGTVTVAAGTGGNAVSDGITVFGGGGGASTSAAGNSGSTRSSAGKNGGDGGGGASLIVKNTAFA